MIVDARTVTTEETIETEVCIVGGGPAGITLAYELMNQKFRVCLVESGGFDFDPQTQSLSQGKVVGQPHPPLDSTRLRQFGGTAHTWESELNHIQRGWRSLPLDAIDFEQREWLPYSGWPFTRADLDPFYERAHQLCQLGPFTYKAEDWQSNGKSPLPFKSDRIMTSVSQYGDRTPFIEDYPRAISQAQNITVLLHANITEIEVDDAGQTVTRLKGRSLQGHSFWIASKLFVLASGGIENARLLLLSNQQQPAGIGNQHDRVGRFFMEHPSVIAGMLTPYKRKMFDQTALYDMHQSKSQFVVGELHLNPDLMQREQLLNSGIQLFPRYPIHYKNAQESAQVLVASLRHAKLPKRSLKHISTIARSSGDLAVAAFWKVVRSLPGLKRGYWSYLPYEKRKFKTFELVYQIEQAPDPENRLVLSQERDALGQNQAEIHWKLNSIDFRTINRVQSILIEEFNRSGLGHLQTDLENVKFFKLAGHHHMGTTRMHHDPKQGVVNAEGRVHGVHNLFITGSSVFPTSGYANPTLTIIALAIRLADHLKGMMQQGG
ncbi:GMC family oxidoreductase [Oscillatoria sp. FACHB-1407]|uniref:FAD-dependent oxidoreductase n=1 Tax=Oscillatoria sp. FACHB-1407 TaxID=2692847 RepID=UPI00168A1E70|nr:GMC family oxidoreductase [Oscillatoria sp. FACHB-1407]MBD2459683.1 GMC family oxidoreductase [Oscillatoria sp. FACHB-1407]